MKPCSSGIRVLPRPRCGAPSAHTTVRHRTTGREQGVETRRIVLDGAAVGAVRESDDLVVADGRRVPISEAHHLSPVEPTKIVCVHLNYRSRVDEFIAKLGPAPTYFHKPVSAL